ncbi:MAG: hypothetical protein JO187_09980, partial [Acidobacteria bacterium]|nr:hypothetical protein [Acidobacteriota bacterium]
MKTDLMVPVEQPDVDELSEWLEAFDQVVEVEGAKRGTELLKALAERAQRAGVHVPVQLNTPYVNTIRP